MTAWIRRCCLGVVILVWPTGLWAWTGQVETSLRSLWPRDALWTGPVREVQGRVALAGPGGHWGWAVSWGQGSWHAADTVVGRSVRVTDRLEGQLDLSRLGLGWWARRPVTEVPWFWATAEVGLDRCWGDADLFLRRETDTGSGTPDVERFTLNGSVGGWVGRAVLGLELRPQGPDDPVRWVLRGGFQWDPDPSEVATDDWVGRRERLDLSGGFVEAGLVLAW